MTRRGDKASPLPTARVKEEVDRLLGAVPQGDTSSAIEDAHLLIASNLGLAPRIVVFCLRQLKKQGHIGLVELMGRTIVAPMQANLTTPGVMRTQGTRVKLKGQRRTRRVDVNTTAHEDDPSAEVDTLHEQITELTDKLEKANKRATTAEETRDRLRTSLADLEVRRAADIRTRQELEEEIARLTPMAERVTVLEQRIAELTAKEEVSDEMTAVITDLTEQ